ncbi:SCO-spondin [Mizuhopecten yessoensis]|uniref:SCO-spondin n=1 Tax=Mizuhopecten yessoensis TaxID=6573 RepID=A0A210Q7E0_MIZYE|nr:SCO-spondin [Mizuhopecten yessoensis]
MKKREIIVDGKIYTRSSNTYLYRSTDIYVKQATTSYIMVKGFGFFLLYDTEKSLYLTLDRLFMNKVYGLFGTYDDVTSNDFETTTGSLEADAHIFADTFKDCSDTSKPYVHSCSDPVQATAEYLCDPLITHSLFAPCVARMNGQYYHEKCMEDVCSGRPEHAARIACHWTGAMAMACSQLGPEYVVNWMDYITWTMCASYTQCPAGSSYSDCASICSGRSHDVQYPDPSCQEMCVPGCQCPVEMLYSEYNGGSCVYPRDAGCFDPYSNAYVAPNDVVVHGCSNCTCVSAAWKCDVEECEVTCPKNQIYKLAISVCDVTCVDLDKSIACTSLLTHDRCACPENQYKTPEGTCVSAAQCPCSRRGQFYAPGSTYEESCKKFRCFERQWIKFEEMNCPAVCWTSGDTHFNTFDLVHYSFQGDCEYTLAKDRDGNTFDIIVQNVPCGSSGVTCTRTVKLQLHNNVTVSMLHGAPVKVSGDVITGRNYRDEQLEIAIEFPWVSVFVPSMHLTVMWDNGTRLYVYLGADWSGRVEGLCGNFDGNDNNDFLAQTGVTYQADVNTFANSWNRNTMCLDVEMDPSGLVPCTVCTYSLRWACAICFVIPNSMRRGHLLGRTA